MDRTSIGIDGAVLVSSHLTAFTTNYIVYTFYTHTFLSTRDASHRRALPSETYHHRNPYRLDVVVWTVLVPSGWVVVVVVLVTSGSLPSIVW
jgi:hypothetical protein